MLKVVIKDFEGKKIFSREVGKHMLGFLNNIAKYFDSKADFCDNIFVIEDNQTLLKFSMTAAMSTSFQNVIILNLLFEKGQ